MNTTTMEAWASQTTITLPRFSLERAVLHLDKIEGLALIRAAYGCNVQEAQEVRTAIYNRTGASQ